MKSLWAAIVTTAALLALSWCSRVPVTPSNVDYGLLRLSWRMAGRSSEHCRQRTDAELAALAVHMRTPRVCERRGVSYRLIVEIDEARADTTLLKPAGAMGDRPVFVLHEARLAPGQHRVDVRLEPITHGPRVNTLTFDDQIRFARNSIELITLSEDGNGLLHRVNGRRAIDSHITVWPAAAQ